MIIYRKVIVKCIHKQNMGYERFFKSHFEDFPGTNLILFCWIRIVFAWIRIRNEFFHILDPDPNQNDMDPPHCFLPPPPHPLPCHSFFTLHDSLVAAGSHHVWGGGSVANLKVVWPFFAVCPVANPEPLNLTNLPSPPTSVICQSNTKKDCISNTRERIRKYKFAPLTRVVLSAVLLSPHPLVRSVADPHILLGGSGSGIKKCPYGCGSGSGLLAAQTAN